MVQAKFFYLVIQWIYNPDYFDVSEVKLDYFGLCLALVRDLEEAQNIA